MTDSVLVLHATEDTPFVCGYLVPALGGAEAVDVLDVSTASSAELERALADRKATIAVMSPAFVSHPWSRLSELVASHAALESDREVIPLVLEECKLPLHVRANIPLDFRSRADWDDEIERLRTNLSRPAPAVAPLPCPYPGMRPFRREDAAHFHGRDDEIAEVLGLLDAGQREIYVIGPSGSGKSSMISAGVLPRLAGTTVREVRPDPALLATALDGVPDGGRAIVFVDQLEEMFTQGTDATAALRALRADPRCVLLLALRADFFAELLQSELWPDGSKLHVDLSPLRGDGLRKAIELPARDLDVYFETGLIDRLLADAANEPGVLPLLQETLVQLWNRRRHRLLTHAAYEAAGEGGRSGLAVAISSRADRCLREMTLEQVAIARRLLLRLVSFGDGRPNTRRRQTCAQLGAREPAIATVLHLLVSARLVSLDGDGDSIDDRVDLCHEALITAWPSFATWVDDRRADELRRRKLQSIADEWVARGRGATGLLDEIELANALAWRDTDAARVLGESAEVTALVEASRRAIAHTRRRARRRLAAVLGGLTVFSAVTAVLAVFANGQANTARRESVRARSESVRADRALGEGYRLLGSQAIGVGEPNRAISYLIAARERGVDDRSLRMEFRAATRTHVIASMHHAAAVVTARFSEDGTRVVTASADRTARVWDAATGSAITPPLVHPLRVSEAMFDRSATHVLTTCDDNIVRIWEPASGKPPVLLTHISDVNSAAFSADGALVVTAGEDHKVRIWNARTGALAAPPLDHGARATTAELGAGGTRVATTVGDKLGAGIWDVASGKRIAAFRVDLWSSPSEELKRHHFDLVLSAKFSRDGTRIVTGSADNTARVWDAVTGAPLLRVLEHQDHVDDATISPDGSRIATASDKAVRFWDGERGTPTGPVLEHPQRVLGVSYTGDGSRIVTQAMEKTVRVWDATSGTQVAAIDLESGAATAVPSFDGTRLVTASADGVARIWRIDPTVETGARAERANDAAYGPRGMLATLLEGVVEVSSPAGVRRIPVTSWTTRIAIDPPGERLAAIGIEGDVQIISLASGKVLAQRPETIGFFTYRVAVPRAAFSPDGRRFGTTNGPTSARIWESDTGKPVTGELIHGGPVQSIDFSPRGDRAVTASRDGTARLWDATTGVAIGPAMPHAPGTAVTNARFSPDGKLVVTIGTDRTVRLWEAGSNRPLHVLSGHAAWISAAEFSSDSTRLLTASHDRSVRMWNVAAGGLAMAPLELGGYVFDATLSPDGAWIATACERVVQVWNARTGVALTPPFVHPESRASNDMTLPNHVRGVHFRPDGTAVVSTDRNGSRVWDLGLDDRTLDEWREVARTGSYPMQTEALRGDQ